MGGTLTAAACAEPRCAALVVEGSIFCVVHQALAIRHAGDVPILCTSCGCLIRIGARWIVRAEGAFHATARCLNRPSALYSARVHWPRPAQRTTAP